jgi:hypothetical protein
MNNQIIKILHRLSLNQWQSLISKAQKNWSTILDKDKAVITRGQRGSKDSPSSSMMN